MSTENRGIPDERGYVEPPATAGVPPLPPPIAPGSLPPPSSGKAVAALVLGIISCLLFCVCGGAVSLTCGIVAVVLGSQAEREMLAGRFEKGNLGIAKAGRVCGIVGVCLGGLFLAVNFIGMFAHAARNY